MEKNLKEEPESLAAHNKKIKTIIRLLLDLFFCELKQTCFCCCQDEVINCMGQLGIRIPQP